MSAPEEILSGEMVLAPAGQALRCAELREFRKLTVEPFHEGRVAVLAALSDALLRHPQLRREPAAAALGFWLRRANLVELQASFPVAAGVRRVPTGLVFHVTPANVDTMFVYSWALSFLAGNANLVRLTTRLSPLMTALLGVIDAIMRRHADAVRGNWFVSYEHDDRRSNELSLACDLRIVWGGDETVRRLRAVPLNPHAAERSFASKRSFCVIGASAYGALDGTGRRQVAERVVADILPFGQMACSSPHEVYWVGPKTEGRAHADAFQRELEAVMVARGAGNDIGNSVRRLSAGFAQAIVGQATTAHFGSATAWLLLDDPARAARTEACGAGLLTHACVADLSELVPFVRSDHQTITHFGIATEQLAVFAAEAGRAGVDRLVPIGQALAFSPHWDGYDLWSDLTRMVTVR